MPQSDGKNKLKRMMFKNPSKKMTFTFSLNPQEYKYTAPQRTSTLKTIDRIIVEDFNGDIPTIEISGHTGWKRGQGEIKAKALKLLLNTYANGSTNYGAPPKKPLEFYNFTDGEYYYVHLAPDGYSISRSVDAPLLFNFSIKLYVIGKIGEYTDLSDEVISKYEISTGDENVATGDSGTYSNEDGKSSKASKDNKKPKKGGKVVKGKTELEKLLESLGVDAKNGYDSLESLGILLSGTGRLRDTAGVS